MQCRSYILLKWFIAFFLPSLNAVKFRLKTKTKLRSAKLVPTFADRGVSRGQRNGSPQPLISVF